MVMKPVSSFTEAIYELLNQFGDRLKIAGAPKHSVRAYVFGGCAVHLYSSTRVSSDLDLEVDTVLVSSQDIVLAKRAAGKVFISVGPDSAYDILEIDQKYTSALGPVHEDFTDRAKVIEMRQGSPLVALLPAPEDIALSKLDRLSEKDVADIVALMGHPGASWELLQKLTDEAEKYYPGIKGGLTSKLNYVIRYKRT